MENISKTLRNEQGTGNNYLKGMPWNEYSLGEFLFSCHVCAKIAREPAHLKDHNDVIHGDSTPHKLANESDNDEYAAESIETRFVEEQIDVEHLVEEKQYVGNSSKNDRIICNHHD